MVAPNNAPTEALSTTGIVNKLKSHINPAHHEQSRKAHDRSQSDTPYPPEPPRIVIRSNKVVSDGVYGGQQEPFGLTGEKRRDWFII